MAIGKKTGGKDFAPGVSGNPAGRTPTPPDLKQARLESKEKLERALHKYAFMQMREIRGIASQDDQLPAIEALVVSILERAVTHGDYTRAAFIFDRMFGKVPDNLNVGGSLHAQLVALMQKTSEA